jgi:hypothetical protein
MTSIQFCFRWSEHPNAKRKHFLGKYAWRLVYYLMSSNRPPQKEFKSGFPSPGSSPSSSSDAHLILAWPAFLPPEYDYNNNKEWTRYGVKLNRGNIRRRNFGTDPSQVLAGRYEFGSI